MVAHSTRGNAILSVLKIVVWAVIATAMVKFAFFPDSRANGGGTPDPSAEYGQITVTPQRATISSTLSLEGTIQTDPATPIKATLEGKVSRLYVQDGSSVVKGDPILQIAREAPGDDSRSSDGDAGAAPSRAAKKYAKVYAPADGTVSLNALVDQQFSVGDSVGSVQPSSHSVVANLTPDQMYRIQQAPTSATITIKNGPAPFECQGLRIVTPKSSSPSEAPPRQNEGSGGGSGSGDSGNSSSSSIQATCAIPSDQKVFPGLQAKVELVAGQANDVLTLPVTAVEGRYQTGYVYVPGDDPANPKRIQVSLGLTDGHAVEIAGGLSEEQEVLEFVPGQAGPETGCDPVTGEGC